MAQNISDSIFKNVTLIENRNVLKSDNDYLIDVVMKYDVNDIPVIFNDSRELSKQFFFNELCRSKPMLLMTPDWAFYDAVAEEADSMGGCIEPAPAFIYYQKKYYKNKLQVDSIKITENYPKLFFNLSVKELKAKEDIVFYHTESFGSTCCPKDPKWEMKDKLDGFITYFEQKNSTKLGDVYKKITGKEGEHILYFTLSNLNTKQKLNFLQEIRHIYVEKKNRKSIEISPQIFMPSSIQKEGLEFVTEY